MGFIIRCAQDDTYFGGEHPTDGHLWVKGAQSAKVFDAEEQADTACIEIDPENCLGLHVEPARR